MRVVYLGPYSPICDYLLERGEYSGRVEMPIDLDNIRFCDFIISYGYRHILPPDIVEAFDGKAINLHISYLPWGRGADPNLWSFIESTPKGVSIHYIDKGIDTGDTIYQQLVPWEYSDTLATFYVKLHAALQALFYNGWGSIKAGTCPRTKQTTNAGSYHRTADRPELPDGWNTLVIDL